MAEGFLPVDQHEGSQQRDGHRERNDADLAVRSSEVAVRNGCAMNTPTAINAP
jgi:hypothetical protein